MTRIIKGSNNVYADLGYVDADLMQVKAQLAARIGEIIRKRALTQTEAAVLLGMTQPKLSALLRGQFRGISEDRMMRCLTALGHNVRIVIKPVRGGESGVVSVG